MSKFVIAALMGMFLAAAKVVRIRFRIASINALGATHTDPGPDRNKWGWLNSIKRTVLLTRVLAARKVSLGALQEFQGKQRKKFLSLKQRVYGIVAIQDNAVIWLRAIWRKKSDGHITAPYFGGHSKNFPWAVVEHRKSKKLVAVLSMHAPANVKGPAGHLRDKCFETMFGWSTTMLNHYKLPDGRTIDATLIVGDMNAKLPEIKPFMNEGTKYIKPGDIAGDADGLGGIDHIFAEGDIELVNGREADTDRIDKTTDHPVFLATGVM